MAVTKVIKTMKGHWNDARTCIHLIITLFIKALSDSCQRLACLRLPRIRDMRYLASHCPGLQSPVAWSGLVPHINLIKLGLRGLLTEPIWPFAFVSIWYVWVWSFNRKANTVWALVFVFILTGPYMCLHIMEHCDCYFSQIAKKQECSPEYHFEC